MKLWKKNRESAPNTARLKELTQEPSAVPVRAPEPPSPTETAQYLVQFFRYDHLPSDLQNVSRLFCDVANELINRLPDNPERTRAMRKLLEGKDCAVRAMLVR
jgi:hypothetical protein